MHAVLNAMAKLLTMLMEGLCSNELAVWLTVLLLAAVAVWYLNSAKNLPPGPFSLPIVGSLVTYTITAESMHLVFEKMARKYGPVSSLQFGGRPTVLLNTAASIKEAFVKKAADFSSRPEWYRLTLTNPYRLGIIDAVEPGFKDQRKFAINTLRHFGMGKLSLEFRIQDEIAHLLKCIESKGGEPFDPSVILTNSVSNIICSVVFGQRFDYEDQTFHKILGLINNLFKDFIEYPEIDVTPMVRFLPKYKNYLKKYIKHDAELRAFIKDKIREHQGSHDPENPRDLIDVYLNENDMQSEKGEAGLVQNILDFFIAGTETTSTSLRWMLLHMANNPQIQEKMHDELEREVGGEKIPTMANRNALPYLEATIHEVNRFSTIAPFGVPHMAHRDSTIGGYDIRAGTDVWSNIWAAHHDPEVWQDPNILCPERFLDENNSLKKIEEWIPFSLGRRMCLGEQLAKTELILFTSALFQRFQFLPPEGIDHICDDGVCYTTLAPKPYKVIAKVRSPLP